MKRVVSFSLWGNQPKYLVGALRNAGFLASGPRSPTPGAPYTYVTTKHFLSAFGMETLRDLPDIEALEDAGLLSRNEMAAALFAEASDYAHDDVA